MMTARHTGARLASRLALRAPASTSAFTARAVASGRLRNRRTGLARSGDATRIHRRRDQPEKACPCDGLDWDRAEPPLSPNVRLRPVSIISRSGAQGAIASER